MTKIRSIFLFILFFLFIFNSNIFAAEISSPSATPRVNVNYFLAYPGILPDNPFYFMKATRDRLVSMLINDTRKRAEFNLLTSDKRMFAGQILIEKGKTEEAVIAISKSNNYFHHALGAAQKTAQEKKQTNDLYEKMLLSISKHIELMDDYVSFIPKEGRDFYNSERSRMVEFQKIVQKEISKTEKK